jgi:hypothetical protein
MVELADTRACSAHSLSALTQARVAKGRAGSIPARAILIARMTE